MPPSAAAALMAGDAIQTRQGCKLIGGVQTELCVLEFSDRFVVFLTQLNKPGTMVCEIAVAQIDQSRSVNAQHVPAGHERARLKQDSH